MALGAASGGRRRGVADSYAFPRHSALTARIVIVGSGPAGVSAAWPLVRAGLEVLMLDAAGPAPMPAAPAGTIGAFRRAPDRWQTQFGASLERLGAGGDLSPKLATPLAHAALAGYAEALGLVTDRFMAFGSLGAGGLSSIWGAMTPNFEEADFADFPITAADMAPSYRAVSERIGVSTAGGDGPALTRAPKVLLARHERRPSRGVLLAPARSAVLIGDRDGRQGCAACGLCLWGCARRSIYNSAYELPELLRYSNFTYRPGLQVRAVHGGNEVAAEDETIRADLVVLAAGTIATTALVAGNLGTHGSPIRLLSNPVAAIAYLLPGLLGAALPEQSFALAQLRHQIALGDGCSAGGAIYGGDTLPLTEIARRIPLSRPTALRLSRALAPALLFATIYLPGDFSDNRMTVRPGCVSITGRIGDGARAAFREARLALTRMMRGLGAYAVPLSFTISEAGADAHYAGTIPMGGSGPLACSAQGEVRGCPGLYVVDGAALSTLPAKHCTLTIMANADRIGRRLAALMTG